MSKDTANRKLNIFTRNRYFDAIPLDDIFRIVENDVSGMIVDEDNEKWSGLLLGENSSTTFKISGRRFRLFLSWYKMPSGRYEIIAYVS